VFGAEEHRLQHGQHCRLPERAGDPDHRQTFSRRPLPRGREACQRPTSVIDADGGDGERLRGRSLDEDRRGTALHRTEQVIVPIRRGSDQGDEEVSRPHVARVGDDAPDLRARLGAAVVQTGGDEEVAKWLRPCGRGAG
jgi:hypothetical protein